MSPLRCPLPLVDDTLAHLREAGHRGRECVVFWLAARPVAPGTVIREAYRPKQVAASDMFRIPPAGMATLMTHLRARKFALAAQVHSHPGRAFHSRADDEWAVVRHEGALSIVVPNFAARTDARTFLDAIAAFRLSAADRWIELSREELPYHVELTA